MISSTVLVRQFQSLVLNKVQLPSLLKLHDVTAIEMARYSTIQRPKRPLTGFFLFLAEKRKISPNLAVTNLTKNAGLQWKSMTDAQKKPYVDKWLSSMQSYKEELQRYEESLSALDRGILKEEKRMKMEKKKERKIKLQRKKARDEAKRELGFPRMPYSAYICYTKARMAMMPIRTLEGSQKALSQIAKEWKRLPNYRKEEFDKRAALDKMRYERELKACIEKARLQDKLHLLPDIVRREVNREEKMKKAQ